jgi:hypothetical protein
MERHLIFSPPVGKIKIELEYLQSLNLDFNTIAEPTLNFGCGVESL